MPHFRFDPKNYVKKLIKMHFLAKPLFLLFLTIINLKLTKCGRKNTSLAPTPPMLWMSWQRYRCTIDCEQFPNDCISEKLIREQAERMKNDGWLQAGYDTIVIDDCWNMHYRDPETNRLVPDVKRFPNGMKHLADYVHSLGLKFGMYGDYGTFTCERYPASMGYEKIDATTFAEWEIDYLKFDGCFSTPEEQRVGYELFGNYLNDTGRNIVYSCSYPAYLGGLPEQVDYNWLGSVCHQWRNYYDIDDSFYSLLKIIEWYGDNMDKLRKFMGPGRWHDPDMLLVGNFGLTEWQSKIQMSIWAMLAAPLQISVDLRDIDQKSRDILLNPLVIQVNQDQLAIPGYRIGSRAGFEMWARPLSNNEFAIVIFSVRTDGSPREFDFQIDFAEEYLKPHMKMKQFYIVQDVWQDAPNKDGYPEVVDVTEKQVVYIRPHGALMWILRPIRSEKDMEQLDYEQRAKIRDTL